MAVQARQIEITPIEENLEGELAKEIYYECGFCGKRVAIHQFARTLCERLSTNVYYCNFCLRHGFHTKNNKNVLILTFRSVIGHYYKEFYIRPIQPAKRMYISEIDEYVNAHVQAGLLNPAFYYNPDAYLWFVDFSKVGKGNKKITLHDVLKTIINIIACFNLKSNLYNVSMSSFYEKYKDAIEKFYTSRYRPAGRMILIPSLNVYTSDANEMKSFTSDLLIHNID